MEMREEGRIVEISGNLARVKVRRSDACGSCRSCTENPDGSFVIDADNTGGLKLGQKVRIEIAEKTVIKGVLLLYGGPTLGLLAGVTIGAFVSKSLSAGSAARDILPVIFGIAALIITFLFIAYLSRKRTKGPKAKIVEAIE